MIASRLGVTVFLMGVIPVSYLIRIVGGGMYGTFFKQFPPAVYVSLTVFLSFGVCFLISHIFIKKTNLDARLPTPTPASALIIISSIIILFPMVMHIFTSMIEGGGVSIALMSFTAPIVNIAKVTLIIGLIKLLMAVKPHESYVYQ